jgi:hypothetical protein
MSAVAVDDRSDTPARALVTSATFNKIRHARKRAFLAAFAECRSVTEAAHAAGIDRTSHYVWLANDERYAEAFAIADDIAIETVEREARRRAIEGVLEAVYFQGKVVGYQHRYSDNLLMFLLKGARPDTYRDNSTIRHTGADGGAIKVEAEYELSRRIMDRPDLLAAAELLAAELYQTAPAGELDAGVPIPVESEEVDDGE